ncbi:MAG: hypothetical protein HC911_03415 [Chloroflexaceae bacterium]|nr:hypothetical protein [Chloroflexaceae bacterium]
MVNLDAQGTSLFLQINGTLFLLVILGIGGWFGWRNGIRALLTPAIVSGIAYLLFVSGIDPIIGFINRVYSNLPYLIAILTGGSAAQATPLPPAITNVPQLGLLVRIFFFIGTVALGFILNSDKQLWYGQPKNQTNRMLGAYTGAMIAAIFANAATVFFIDYVNERGNPGNPWNALFGILPDIRTYVPLMFGVFVLMVVTTVVLNFPKALRP